MIGSNSMLVCMCGLTDGVERAGIVLFEQHAVGDKMSFFSSEIDVYNFTIVITMLSVFLSQYTTMG